MDANSVGLYPIASMDYIVEAPKFAAPPQHSEEGVQQEPELPNTAILPYLSLIFSLTVLSLLINQFTL